MAKDLRGHFSCCKADDEVRLAPDEEDNATARKIDRKDWMVLKLIDYIIAQKIPKNKGEPKPTL
jgi:hypothetical protein